MLLGCNPVLAVTLRLCVHGFCVGSGSVLSGSCWLQAAASGELALFAFDAAAAAPRDSLVAALGMMAQASP